MEAKGPTSLARIYQARKSNREDSSKVEVLKRQFQDQIEQIINEKGNNNNIHNTASLRSIDNAKLTEREKSFNEARCAVQTQIEKIFEKSRQNNGINKNKCGGLPVFFPAKPTIPTVPDKSEDKVISINKEWKSTENLDTIRSNNDIGKRNDNFTRRTTLQPRWKRESDQYSIKNFSSMSELDRLKEEEEEEDHATPGSMSYTMLGSTLSVRYLGALPLSETSTDLTSLQLPMKELYFKYLFQHQEPRLCVLNISRNGLHLATGTTSTFNPFPTIAVWAAVKFVYRTKDDSSSSFAFLPLVSDPRDKESLFHPLTVAETKAVADRRHFSLFACIMRRTGTSKKLECHGFLCKSSSEAVRIASSLYQSLKNSVSNSHRKILNSTSSSRSREKAASVPSLDRGRKQQERKYRRKKVVEEGEENTFSNSAKRAFSTPNLDGIPPNNKTIDSKGDIYTKVAMPRSRSFMNVNAIPYSSYNLQDLFRELRDREGVESVDDILRLVINPNGISFNKIPPMYRDLLMKLVMSMSKDEIFIRSKNIMSEERFKSKKKTKSSQKLNEKKKKNGEYARNVDLREKKLNISSPIPISIDEIDRLPPSKAIDLNLIKKTLGSAVVLNAKPILNSVRDDYDGDYDKSCSECGEKSSVISCSVCSSCGECCSTCSDSTTNDDFDEYEGPHIIVVDSPQTAWKKNFSPTDVEKRKFRMVSSSSSSPSSYSSSSSLSSKKKVKNDDSFDLTIEFDSDSTESSQINFDSSLSSGTTYKAKIVIARKGKERPAYSESNMHNSLGYLP